MGKCCSKCCSTVTCSYCCCRACRCVCRCTCTPCRACCGKCCNCGPCACCCGDGEHGDHGEEGGKGGGGKKGGKAPTKIEKIEIAFKPIGIGSVDKALTEAEEVIGSINAASAPLIEARDAFFKATGFDKEPMAKLEHAFLGMFIGFVAGMNGDMTDIGLDFIAEAPYVKIKLPPPLQPLENMVTTFEDYVKAVYDTVVNKFPDIMKQAADLPGAINDAKNSAMGEIQGLGLIAKGKAIAGIAGNVKNVIKVPKALTSAVTALKQELEDCKATIEKVKE